MNDEEITCYKKQIIKTENINNVYSGGGQRIYEITHPENLTEEEIENHYKNIEKYYNYENKKSISLRIKYYEEIWQEWPSHKGFYASNFGRVRLNKDGQSQILEQADKEVDLGGYLYLKGYGYDEYNVPQIVAETFLGPREKDCEIHHISNDGYDNRPENLIYVSKDDHNKRIHGKG